ncbi:MAG: hypothetical protein ACTHNT_09805 [Actinomycetales bacterium]
MSDPLLTARAAVLHDLAARSLNDAAVVTVVEDVLAERRWWVEQWPDGARYVAGQVAQDVQERLLESHGRWPRCVGCPSGAGEHELRFEPELGDDPTWVCEEASMTVAPLGSLTAVEA